MKVTDPTTAPNFNMTRIEKEEFLIFCMIVAGKNAMTTKAALHKFWLEVESKLWWTLGRDFAYLSPFDLVWRYVGEVGWDGLSETLRKSGIGCYRLKTKYLVDLVNKAALIDFDTCTPKDLEQIQGIGPKTSRFFLLWTRKDANYACLDTHVLRWLREQGVDSPKTTPTGKKYAKLEQEFLKRVPEGTTPMEFDFSIWMRYHKEVKVTA
jgi:endonuclease III